MNWLSLIFGALDPISRITGQITDLQKQKISAASDLERQKLQNQIEGLHDQRMVMMAEAASGNRINSYMRTYIALGPATYIFKIFAWDKVIGSFMGCAGVTSQYCRANFQTDPLVDPNLIWAMVSVIGLYTLATLAVRK